MERELTYEEDGYVQRLSDKQIDAFMFVRTETNCLSRRLTVGAVLPDRALRIIDNIASKTLLKERGQ